MPDPLKQTISATEAPGLFGASPYVTRWMLYQKFAKDMPLDGEGDARMNWGKKLQPLILQQAAEDIKLEVRPNADDSYHRRGRLGCTRDAVVICPDRGPGALETKCVFDLGVWMRDWQGGKAPPRHHEIQLQTQMHVGDDDGPYTWGIIAAWVCGEMHYFERTPLSELWIELRKEAERLFEDVAAGREPNAFGEPVEWPLMAKLFAVESGRILDLREDPIGIECAGDVIALASNAEARLMHEKEEKRLKNKLMARLNGADKALLPGGVQVDVKRSPRAGYTVKPTTSISLKHFIPDGVDLPEPAPKPGISLAEIRKAG